MTKKNIFLIVAYSLFLMVMVGVSLSCSDDDEERTYTVWVSTESYSEYSKVFGTLSDGSYRRTEMFSGEINYSALNNEYKRDWTENDIYNWLYGRGFISSEAREVTAWIVSTRHCIIANRRGSIVDMLIK
jgi:hypothetical protein